MAKLVSSRPMVGPGSTRGDGGVGGGMVARARGREVQKVEGMVSGRNKRGGGLGVGAGHA